jgi:hypothetical protein
MPTDFERALAYGAEGEHIVANWLLDRGSAVAPLYQYTNHDQAPVILWDDSARRIRCVLPDLHCYRDGAAYFAEVKRKNQWWHNRPLKCLETGMNVRLWHEYRRVREKTGCPVYIFFLHETMEPTGLFYGEIEDLAKQGPREWTKGDKPKMFVRQEWLRKACELDALSIQGTMGKRRNKG